MSSELEQKVRRAIHNGNFSLHEFVGQGWRPTNSPYRALASVIGEDESPQLLARLYQGIYGRRFSSLFKESM